MMHFSGHGIQNVPENLGIDYARNEGKGDILMLEDGYGMAKYYFEKDLIGLVQNS